MPDPSAADAPRWADKLELAELVAAVSSAMDRGDRAGMIACYAEDSFDDHGTFKGSGAAFAQYVCGSGALGAMHHLLGQSLFDVDGDEAWGETFWVFHGRAGTVEVSGHGRYVDYFVRVEGRWKLKYRRVVPDAVPVGDDIGAYWPSRRDRQDPLYDRRRSPDDAGSAR